MVLAMSVLVILDGLSHQVMVAKNIQQRIWVGGDLVVKSPQLVDMPLPTKDGLEQADSIKMATMLTHGSQSHLVHLQIISDNYPLAGSLVRKGRAELSEGEVWISEVLSSRHNLEVGAQVSIGDGEWTVADIVMSQDEQVFGMEAFNPSVYIRWGDQDRTGLVKPNARLNRYTYLGGDQAVSELRPLLESVLPKAAKVIDPSETLGRLDKMFTQVKNVLDMFRLLGYMTIGFLIHLGFEACSK